MVVAPAANAPVTVELPLTVNAEEPAAEPPPITVVPEFNVPVVVLPVTDAEASVDAPAFNVPVVVLPSVAVPTV